MKISRRQFIASAATTCVALSIPEMAFGLVKKGTRAITIGIITDLHQDIMHDAPQRLDAFIRHIRKTKTDAIIQLGDFAYPGEKNKSVIDRFNQAHRTALHVIGNHDTDSGHTKEQCISIWGMPDRYYTRDIEGIRLIVLDGNDKGSPMHKGGYPSFIGKEQIDWLKQTLNESVEPVIIASHQPLAGHIAVDNAAEIQEILGNHRDKVLLAINGHSHIDSHLNINGVNYIHFNSASYFWVGEEYKHESYSKEILDAHPWIASTCPYRDGLFATLTIDPRKREIIVKGQKSSWVGKSPVELGYGDTEDVKNGREITPEIKNRKFTV